MHHCTVQLNPINQMFRLQTLLFPKIRNLVHFFVCENKVQDEISRHMTIFKINVCISTSSVCSLYSK